MNGKMNREYFAEKRDAAAEDARVCVQAAEEAHALIRSVNYQLPNLVSPMAVHDALKQVARSAEFARYQFEKARWAATGTCATLGEWLQENDCAELVRFGD